MIRLLKDWLFVNDNSERRNTILLTYLIKIAILFINK